jgi:hypothetical protein
VGEKNLRIMTTEEKFADAESILGYLYYGTQRT